METATMALRNVSRADEFEASVSMNDQNCRVLSCLEFDQSGWMQQLRTGGKVSWNALPAMTKEVAHQRTDARNCPSRQKGSTVVNAPRLISRLERSCTFSIAVTWLSLMYLLSCSLPRWAPVRTHFLNFCIMYGILLYYVRIMSMQNSGAQFQKSIDPPVSLMSLVKDDHLATAPVSRALLFAPISGSSSISSTQTAVDPAYGSTTTVFFDTTPGHNGPSVGGMEAEPVSLVVQTLVRTVSWWPSDEIVQASTQQPPDQWGLARRTFFALVKLAGVRLPSLWDPSPCFPDGMRGIDLAARNKTDCELIEQAERLKKLNLRPLRPCQRGYWVYQPREIFRHVFGHAMTSYLLQQESEEWITDVDFKRILMLRTRTSDILSCISDPAQVEQPVPADVLVAACVLLDSPGLSRHLQYAATVQAINNMANYDAKSRQTEQIHLAAIRSTGRAMAHYSLTSRRVYQFGEPNSYVPGRRAPIAAPTMDRDLARRLNGRKPAPLAALPEREYPGDAAVLAERLANMDNIARQEDTWGAQEDVEVHGWSDADSDV